MDVTISTVSILDRSKLMLRNKFVLIAIFLLIAGFQVLQFGQRSEPAPKRNEATESAAAAPSASSEIEAAYEQQRSNVQVEGLGIVTQLLADDSAGSRHQRFILRLPHGRTLLVAHNIDLAPRIESLRVGDEVRFRGEYEWNNKGGVLHWTHHDPQGQHAGGWLQHADRTYQ
jgi:hypothetical protein